MSADSEAPSARPKGLAPILVATAIAGLAGYIVQAAVGITVVDGAVYLRFSVFWATLYLVIAALSGVQQEVTRATHVRGVEAHSRVSTARNFAVGLSVAVAAVVPLTALFWGASVFPDRTWGMVAALTVGTASYVIVAVLCGVLYGLSFWNAIATITATDGVLRMLLVLIVAFIDPNGDLLIWAVVMPFPITLLIVWPFIRRRVVGLYALDVSGRQLIWNATRTVGGSLATGLLISGFPLIVDLTSKHESANAVGVLVFVITLTRAPLVVPLLALQSFLTIYFRDRVTHIWRLVGVLLLAVAAVATVLALLAWGLGPLILTALKPEFVLPGQTIAVIVATAGITAALCVSGPATLAAGRHNMFLAGWLVAAAGLIAFMLLPFGLEVRVLGALTVGPTIGLVVHLVAIGRARGTTSSASEL